MRAGLVCGVCLGCLVRLVCLGYGPREPDKPKKPNEPDEPERRAGLVYLVPLVCLVCLDYLLEPDHPDEPERPARPERPNEPERRAGFALSSPRSSAQAGAAPRRNRRRSHMRSLCTQLRPEPQPSSAPAYSAPREQRQQARRWFLQSTDALVRGSDRKVQVRQAPHCIPPQVRPEKRRHAPARYNAA